VPAISTGDIFRANVANATELGLKVKAIMDAGEYVPDDITNAIVVDRLREPDAVNGFLLDGYPRTPEQVAELDRVLESEYEPLNAAVQLDADPDEVVGRLLKRAVEQGRADDTEDVIRHRMGVYEQQTAPLVELFAQRGLLVKVDALGSVDDVTQRILTALAGAGVIA
jgi:adenylate kinase